MARVAELDFEGFVRRRASGRTGELADDAHAYAYVADRATRATFERLKPVELAVAAGVRAFQHVGRAKLLGNAVRVGPRQFPRVDAIAASCAKTLGIAPPTLYVVNSPQLNAGTYGTNQESFMLLNSALIDHFSDEELASVVGHECGHIHNSHVVYLTALHYLTRTASLFVRGLALPAVLALQAWSRRAEVTSDRAAALCAGNIETPVRALAKLALGSKKLYEELDLDEFVTQGADVKGNFGRFGELFDTHPWLVKRVLALRAFGESALFRAAAGLGEGGLQMAAVDENVHELIKVVG